MVSEKTTEKERKKEKGGEDYKYEKNEEGN